MEDFIFGTLSTVDLRVKRTLSMRSGIHHGNRIEPIAPQAGDEPLLTVLVKHKQGLDHLAVELAAPTPMVINLKLVDTDWDLLDWRYVQRWQCRLPAQPDGTLVEYHICGADVDGNAVSAEKETFAYYVGDPTAPAWTKSSIIYQIFPDRFAGDGGTQLIDRDDANEIFGGTLNGIIARLDYVADLGFNCIWLNPFFPDNTHHGYHASDYFAVNPRLGTMDDIRTLVDAAHARGIRVLLDFVCNHWGATHPSFQEAQRDQNSDAYNWYNWIEWPEQYETFFGVKALPQINVDYPPARQHLLDSAEFWLADVGFDGLRLDYAVGPSHSFWAALRQRVKTVKPDAWMFGEVVEDPGSQVSYQGRFDGCIDFMLGQALRATFALETMSLTEFEQFLQTHQSFFPAWYSQPSFFDNHDMDRLTLLANGDHRKVKLAALCMLTLPGPPVVYYGTECGVGQRVPMHGDEGVGMAEARRPMLWDDAQDRDMQAYFRDLIHFRAAHPAIVNGTRTVLHLDDTTRTYAYRIHDDNESVRIAFNLSDETQSIALADETLTLPPYGGLYSSTDVTKS